MRDFESSHRKCFESIASTTTIWMKGSRAIRLVAVVNVIEKSFKGHILTLSMYLFVREQNKFFFKHIYINDNRF